MLVLLLFGETPTGLIEYIYKLQSAKVWYTRKYTRHRFTRSACSSAIVNSRLYPTYWLIISSIGKPLLDYLLSIVARPTNKVVLVFGSPLYSGWTLYPVQPACTCLYRLVYDLFTMADTIATFEILRLSQTNFINKSIATDEWQPEFRPLCVCADIRAYALSSISRTLVS